MSILKNKTLDDILKGFTKTVEELNTYADKQVLEAQRQSDIAREAQEQKELAERNAKKAFATRDKINKLIGE